jgi:hypothetical protein
MEPGMPAGVSLQQGWLGPPLCQLLGSGMKNAQLSLQLFETIFGVVVLI